MSIIRNYFKKLSEIPHVQSKPDDKTLKAMEKEQRDNVKRDIELFDAATNKKKKTPIEDKEMLAIARRFENAFDTFDTWNNVKAFKEALAIVAKAEKTVLASKGFTANDNIDDVISAYKKDLEQAKDHLSYLNSDKHKQEVMVEVRQKKEQMAVAGKSIEQRVSEFAKLNYLLSYKFADRPPDGSIPKTEKSAQSQSSQSSQKPAQSDSVVSHDDDKALRIRIAKAKLKLLKLDF
jgi:hypothetical protein